MKEKKERELTKAELERKENFEKKKESLLKKGYSCKDCTIGAVYANVMAFLSAGPFILILTVLYMMANGDINTSVFREEPGIVFFVVTLICIVIHELIHGFTWGLFAENHFKDISFGVIWSMLTPYCCCKTTLKKGQYLLGGIMPLIVLGILPSVYGIVTGNLFIFLLGIVMVLGAGGDLIIAFKMLIYKTKGKEVVIMDHPYECGFIVFEK